MSENLPDSILPVGGCELEQCDQCGEPQLDVEQHVSSEHLALQIPTSYTASEVADEIEELRKVITAQIDALNGKKGRAKLMRENGLYDYATPNAVITGF